MHRQPDFLAAKQDRLWEPHVAPINEYVRLVAAETGSTVPYVDPDSGGIAARALFVLESPAGPAALGSGMLSADNDDATASNVWHAYEATGMPRTFGLHWNAVPWYVGTDTKNRSVTRAQEARGQEYLIRLLELTSEVAVLVAFGKAAARSVGRMAARLEAQGIQVLTSIHPGPQNYSSRPWARAEVHETFRQALELIEAGEES
jgi:uracil-DNA glycosylase